MTYSFIDDQTYKLGRQIARSTMDQLHTQMREDSWHLKSEDIRKLKLTLALLKTQITLLETNIQSHETDTTATH